MVVLAVEQAAQRMHEAPADPAQHARVVERLREVLQAQDRAGLMDLLGLTVAGAQRADETVAALDVSMAAMARGALYAEALTLDGEPGIALIAEDGELTAWLHVRVAAEVCAEPVVCIEVSAGMPALMEANRAWGGTAVRQLLAHVASGMGGAVWLAGQPSATMMTGGVLVS
jgi:hypothetical protein